MKLSKGDRVRVCDGSGIDSGNEGVLTGNGHRFLSTWYLYIRCDNGDVISMSRNRLIKVGE